MFRSTELVRNPATADIIKAPAPRFSRPFIAHPWGMHSHAYHWGSKGGPSLVLSGTTALHQECLGPVTVSMVRDVGMFLLSLDIGDDARHLGIFWL